MILADRENILCIFSLPWLVNEILLSNTFRLTQRRDLRLLETEASKFLSPLCSLEFALVVSGSWNVGFFLKQEPSFLQKALP